MSDIHSECGVAGETIHRSNTIVALESVITTATPASRQYTALSGTSNSQSTYQTPSLLHKKSYRSNHPNEDDHREDQPESYLEYDGRSSTALREEAYRHFAVLEQLRAWYKWEQGRRVSFLNYLLRTVGFPSRPPLPNEEELAEMANFYFPPLDDRKVIVFDLDKKDSTAESWRRHFSKLSNLENCKCKTLQLRCE